MTSWNVVSYIELDVGGVSSCMRCRRNPQLKWGTHCLLSLHFNIAYEDNGQECVYSELWGGSAYSTVVFGGLLNLN